MAAKYSDAEITRLIEERKPLEANFYAKIRLRDKIGHKEKELDVEGVDKNRFRLILRQSCFNTLDFSIILAYRPPDSNQLFRLKRYNGKSHEHTNIIESNTFFNFHIHTATERYQDFGTCEDAYAEPSDTFSDYHAAFKCMLRDCSFDVPEKPQTNLFEESER